MRKNSNQILQELIIENLITNSPEKNIIEDAIINIQKRNPLDLKSLELINKICEKYPDLEPYFIQELTNVENEILRDTGLNRDAFDRELKRIERI